MARRLQIKLEGAKVLVAKLNENALLAGPWSAAMSETAKLAETEIRKRTPLLSGQLEASVTSKVDPRPVPHYVFLNAGAENKGFRYGWALEVGHGKRKKGQQYGYHYAGFRMSTRHWFSGARRKINAQIEPVLNAAARAIEERWAE